MEYNALWFWKAERRAALPWGAGRRPWNHPSYLSFPFTNGLHNPLLRWARITTILPSRSPVHSLIRSPDVLLPRCMYCTCKPCQALDFTISTFMYTNDSIWDIFNSFSLSLGYVYISIYLFLLEFCISLPVNTYSLYLCMILTNFCWHGMDIDSVIVTMPDYVQ